MEETMQALAEWDIDFEVCGEEIIVPGSICLDGLDLTELPDFSGAVVKGTFSCRGNLLRNLKGAPRRVLGNFLCQNNSLKSLIGAPEYVGEGFCCRFNTLKTLAGGPAGVGGDFTCSGNGLESLEGAPERVGGAFFCEMNSLRSLEGGPRFVGDLFICASNPITNLFHAPARFGELRCDYGCFRHRKDIPAMVRKPPFDEAVWRDNLKGEMNGGDMAALLAERDAFCGHSVMGIAASLGMMEECLETVVRQGGRISPAFITDFVMDELAIRGELGTLFDPAPYSRGILDVADVWEKMPDEHVTPELEDMMRPILHAVLVRRRKIMAPKAGPRLKR